MLNINKCIKELQIEENLNRLLFYPDCPEDSIAWGMNYITFSPSKRVRPLLLLQANKIFKSIDEDAYVLAAAVELIHTYSLVHDDLPCMDDDELRRGVPTLHTIKGEAYALLVGDALLTRAFGILGNYQKSANLPLMLNGQMLDIYCETKNITLEEINLINKYKTAALLQLAIILGALNGGMPLDKLDFYDKFGEIIGNIFQIKDDILDITGNEKDLGKKIGRDQKNQKKTLPQLIGLTKTNEILNNYCSQAQQMINDFPANQDFFNNFVDFLKNRDK
jgi:geranylgeranyl diphosphate synthase type II